MRSWFKEKVIRHKRDKNAGSCFIAANDEGEAAEDKTRPTSLPSSPSSLPGPSPSGLLEFAAEIGSEALAQRVEVRTTSLHDLAVQEVLVALETLLREAASPASLPITPHEHRLPSGDRGVSLAFLQAVHAFYSQHSGLSLTMEGVCKGLGEHVTVCTLTLSTGLSLAESVAHIAERDGLHLARSAVSRARGFFSYSWTGTALVDMLAAIDDVVRPLEEASGERHVWIDMFCASQNLLAGVYRSPSITKESDPAGYLARKEDTDRIFDDALEAVSEVYFYCSPLVGEWDAPPHPFLSPQREAKGAPAQPWVRRGAAAITGA